jgi:hypothetical protein
MGSSLNIIITVYIYLHFKSFVYIVVIFKML